MGTMLGWMNSALVRTSSLAAVVTLFFTSLGVHLLPFVLYGAHPLGYDTGFYRRYLIQPLSSFPNTPVPGLGTDALFSRFILDILHFLQIPTDLALYGSYILFFALLPSLFFFWLKPYIGSRTAFIAGMFLVLSSVNYTAYWYMLYKNAFALCLILLAFICYERRFFWPLIFLDIGIALSHKTSAIIYFITLGFLLCVDRHRWKEVILHGAVVGAVLAFIVFDSALSPQSLRSNAVAVFVEWEDFLTLSAGLILAALGVLVAWKKITMPRSLLAFALASFMFPIFFLPFFQRIFVFADIALVAFAAYGLNCFISKIKFDGKKWSPYFFFILVCVVIGLQLGNLEARMQQLRPIQSAVNLERVAAVGLLIPRDALLLTTNEEAPWYEGWTSAHIAAPGMLHDTHSFEEWTAFWDSTSTPERINFLNSFEQPLYISTLGNFSGLIGEVLPCVVEITPNLLRSDCE